VAASFGDRYTPFVGLPQAFGQWWPHRSFLLPDPGCGGTTLLAADEDADSFRAFRFVIPLCQGASSGGLASGGASAADCWIKDLSRDCLLRKKLCIVSERFLSKCQRSATCLALGAPCLAPSANEPPRSRLMSSTPGWESLHFLNVSASRSGSKSMGTRRSRSMRIAP